MKGLTLAESLLPQPPSFHKKKNYEIREELGAGTFGKVMVRRYPVLSRLRTQN